ncbi:MAG TPA: ChbG/HpnK family deacetylase, partial [bacterium]|nr:ChbG/HpnK family deacetylase [bacterium]
LEEIENEYHNQLALAADYGLKLTHIDSHKHLHHFLPIYKIIEKLAKKFNIKKIRIAAEYGFYQYFNDILEFGDNDYLYQMYIQSCLKNGCYKSDWFDEPYNFFGFFYAGKMTIDKYYKLFEAIKQADKPIEIMCHPAYNCRELAQISSLTYHRENELNTLKSAELKELLRDYKLIDFSGLLKK